MIRRSTLRWASVAGLAALAAVGCTGCTGAPSSSQEGGRERVASVESAIVGATATSPPEEDYILFLTQFSATLKVCGATLVAPNLALTAKHCVYDYTYSASSCRGDGSPEPGTGGVTTGDIQLADLAFFTGADARKRYVDQNGKAAAIAKKVIHDGSNRLCSYDLAYVVLDRPITGVPIARMRLGKRPAIGAKLAVAGWGQIEERLVAKYRQRREIDITRVGDAVIVPGAIGAVAPRTLESTPGACSGDSGGPAFDPVQHTVLGVTIRGLGLDPSHPISPCLADGVSIVYNVVADFPDELRKAFTEANAEPWLEGRGGPGYVPFDEACSADLECGGDFGRCSGVTTSGPGRCNLDCSKATCPATHVCGLAGTCVLKDSAEAKAAQAAADAKNAEKADDPLPEESRVSGCAVAKTPVDRSGGLVSLALGLCLALGRRVRRSSSS